VGWVCAGLVWPALACPGVRWLPSRPICPAGVIGSWSLGGCRDFCGEDPGFGEGKGYWGAPDTPQSPDPPRSCGRPGHQRAHPHHCPHPHHHARGACRRSRQHQPGAASRPAGTGPVPPAGLPDTTRSPGPAEAAAFADRVHGHGPPPRPRSPRPPRDARAAARAAVGER
jgi:hypothetical protein